MTEPFYLTEGKGYWEGTMTLYEYNVDGPNGRQYFKDIKLANAYAQKIANETHTAVVRRDVYGGASIFSPMH